ncbi:RNA polymerase sigma factor [Margalitia sp. FSL K6-0131]|uniref:RNA polymerase sigma factor n=1 Tax=Margalitia sp. FSL K6-0131 TaxID=2954604 RepID=UPI0030FBA0E4
MDSKKIISDWFHQYSDDIYQFFLYRIRPSDVEDLVQEVFIRAIKGLQSFQGNSSPKTWLFSIARNVAIDEIRKRKRNKWREPLANQVNIEPIDHLTPDFFLELNEENKLLYKSIQSLKENYRDILILRGINELTTEEAAVILNWSDNKVRSTYHRAKKALQRQLGGTDR